MTESSSTGSSGGPSESGNDQSPPNGSTAHESTWYEEFKVSSDNLVARVRELIREGNVRRVYVKNEAGETLIEIPLTAGVAVTAVAAAVAPVLVAVGAIAALLTQATIGVERRRNPVVDHEEPAGRDAPTQE